MIWAEALVALLFAIFIAVIFAGLAGAAWWGDRRGEWGGGWLWLLVLFLAIWAIGIWVEPAGPLVFGVAWLPFLIIALFVGLMIAAVADAEPRWSRRVTAVEEGRVGPTEVTEAEAAEARRISIFFWILFLGLILAVVFAYV